MGGAETPCSALWAHSLGSPSLRDYLLFARSWPVGTSRYVVLMLVFSDIWLQEEYRAVEESSVGLFLDQGASFNVVSVLTPNLLKVLPPHGFGE